MTARSGISGRWWFPERGRWSSPGTCGSRTTLVIRATGWSFRCRSSCGIFRRRGVLRSTLRSYWLACCAGSGSPGPSGSPGTRRRGSEAQGLSGGSALRQVLAGDQSRGVPGGSRTRGRAVAGRTARRCCGAFTAIHLETGTGPIVNPFPLDRGRRRAHAHHNPMEAFPRRDDGAVPAAGAVADPAQRAGRGVQRDFRRLPSHRDRALVAFYVSTGARASELLSAVQGGVDPGRRVIAVARKGTRRIQATPGVAERSCGCGFTSWSTSDTYRVGGGSRCGGPGGSRCAH